ncbi:MAG: hypothetical protein ACTSX6_11770 [Candidatus Heimdallarchaeaceae archaeon]
MDSKRKKEEDKKEETPQEFRSALYDAYDKLNEDLVDTTIKDKKKKQEVLVEGIKRLEKKSGKELISSKMLSAKILAIRKQAGLSQTLGTASKVKEPILFGKDEFKQKLVRELLVIGLEELADIGNAITIANLVEYFRKTRTNWKVRTGEILEVIREMERKEIIPKRIDIGEDEVLVRFKPLELSTDIQQVLRLATGLPSLTVDKVSSHLNWPVERAQNTLMLMMKMDLAILEETSGEYYFPGLIKIE